MDNIKIIKCPKCGNTHWFRREVIGQERIGFYYSRDIVQFRCIYDGWACYI